MTIPASSELNMGILVSWINSAWSIPHPGDNAQRDALLPQHPSRSFDFPADNALHVDKQPSPPPLMDHSPAASRANTLSPIEASAPTSPRAPAGASSPFPLLLAGAPSNRHMPSVSTNHDEERVPSPLTVTVDPSAAHAGSVQHPTRPASPPPPSLPNLRIDVTAANDPTMDHEMVDASFVRDVGLLDPAPDLYFDDEGLSALEKIYLYARSNTSFHRVFISRSLPQFLPDVSPSDAIEYVIPLMNGLAMDEDEAVKEALVEDLVSSIWWFLTRCRVVDYEVPEDAEPRAVPLLNVQSFTPLLGTLLLNTSANVNAPARHTVVNLLARIRDCDSNDAGHFGLEERRFFQQELIQHVVVGMAHLDSNSDESPRTDEPGLSSSAMQESTTSVEHSDTSPFEVDVLKSPPPPSAVDDELLASTLSSSAHALATLQFLAQEEAESSRAATLASFIQRPPSPIPTRFPLVPISEREPEFAHLISRNSAEGNFKNEDASDCGSPMNVVASLPSWTTEPMQALQNESSIREYVMHDALRPEIQSPLPEHVSESNAATLMEEAGPAPHGADSGEMNSEFNDEQAAIGKLASMSLIAAVTASGPLEEEFQSAFVKEVERAGHDTVYWVRREATFALGALAKVVPEELLYTYLLPLFDSFCDDSVWNVRRSVLFALPAILSRLPFEFRRTRALQTVQRLSADPEPQVRTGVLEVLGEVIYSFHGDDRGPPDEIVKVFIGEEGIDWHSPDSLALEMFNRIQTRTPSAESVFRSRFPPTSTELFGSATHSLPASATLSPSSPMPNSDPARPLICAFNLPAVVLTLGPARWPELRGLYLFLSQKGATKVRQTLAASTGEIAKIIGPENARRDLLYCWWNFVRGQDGAVRTKALEAMEALLEVLDTADRARLAGSLGEIWDNHMKGWREREVLARSLERLAWLFPSDGEVLRSLLRRALRDNTAAVRNAAIETYPQIYEQALSRPDVLRLVTEEVSALAYDESFKKRLAYVECVRSLITKSPKHDRFIDENFWHSIVALSSDKITDVRIGVARLLGIICDKVLLKQRTLPGGVLSIVRSLSEDRVSDVRAFVSHILAPDLRPSTELVYKQVSDDTPSTGTFSRPPPKREPRTLVTGIKDMKISSTLGDHEQQQPQQAAVDRRLPY